MVRAGGQPGTIQIPWPTQSTHQKGGVGEDEGWVVLGDTKVENQGRSTP